MKKISIFGSTGSIGKNTIEVIKNAPENFEVLALVARNDVKTLISQALLLKPSYVVIENEQLFPELKLALTNLQNCEVFCGSQAIVEIAKIKCDLFISAIVGAAGMLPTLVFRRGQFACEGRWRRASIRARRDRRAATSE